MDNLSSGRRFESLLDFVAADQAEWREEEHDDNNLERAAMGLGPCVGDDGPSPTLVLSICLPPPINARGAMGNPRPIEDDARGAPTAPSLTALGPSVGDDNKAPPTARGLTMLGPSVGDDAVGVSDVRLKEDVQRVGTTVFGLPLYRFKYLGRPETYEGVMAHEVLQVMPAAVSLGADGYHRVDYGALGTSMRRVS